MTYPNMRLRKLHGPLANPWMLRVQLAASHRYETLVFPDVVNHKTQTRDLFATLEGETNGA